MGREGGFEERKGSGERRIEFSERGCRHGARPRKEFL
jgi:hypothetical protein